MSQPAARRLAPERTRLAVAGLTLVVLVLLSVAGAVLVPAWHPPARNQVDLGARAAARPPAAARADLPVRSERVTVTGADHALAGRVFAPDVPGRHPAVVLVHGAGAGRWTGLAGIAEALAERGVVALVYDKRPDYSFGSADYAALAGDALGGVRLLRERGDVDRQRVGPWGFSEGGWVLPLAANRRPELVDFLVLVSAPNVAPLRQASWLVYTRLARMGASHSVQQMMARRLGAGASSGSATHDPVPSLARLRQPVLALYGEQDETVPAATSAAVLRATFERSGHRAYSVHVFRGAGHDLRRADGSYPPDYLPTTAGWLHGLPGTAEPRTHMVGPVPAQRYAVPPAPETLQYAPAPIRYGLLAVAAVCYLLGPVLAVTRRLHGRRLWEPAGTPRWQRRRPRPEPGGVAWWRRRARRVAGAGLGAFALGLAVTGVVAGLLVAGLDWGWVATGAWTATRVVAVLAVALTVSTWYRLARAGDALTAAQRVAVGGAALGSSALAVDFASWSMFAVGG